MCVCASACACVRVCVRACVCARLTNYVMLTCASQIRDVLVNNMLPVDILVTKHFGKTVEGNENMSLFCSSALSTSVIQTALAMMTDLPSSQV